MTHYTSPDVPNCCDDQDLVYEREMLGPEAILPNEKRVVCLTCGFHITPMRPGDLASYMISRLVLKGSVVDS